MINVNFKDFNTSRSKVRSTVVYNKKIGSKALRNAPISTDIPYDGHLSKTDNFLYCDEGFLLKITLIRRTPL